MKRTFLLGICPLALLVAVLPVTAEAKTQTQEVKPHSDQSQPLYAVSVPLTVKVDELKPETAITPLIQATLPVVAPVPVIVIAPIGKRLQSPEVLSPSSSCCEESCCPQGTCGPNTFAFMKKGKRLREQYADTGLERTGRYIFASTRSGGSRRVQAVIGSGVAPRC